MLFGTATLFAREPIVTVTSQGENKLMMNLFTQDASAMIRIIDANGYVLFSDKTGKDPKYSKIFDLDPLPEGAYHVEVEGENAIQVINFRVENGQLLLTGEEETWYKPVIRQEGASASLQLLNLAGQPVKVSFRSASGQLLMKHNRSEEELRIEQRYNLTELASGNYTMTVQVGTKIYQKQLVIR